MERKEEKLGSSSVNCKVRFYGEMGVRAIMLQAKEYYGGEECNVKFGTWALLKNASVVGKKRKSCGSNSTQ